MGPGFGRCVFSATGYIPDMQTSPEVQVILGVFGLGGGEIILILALALILIGANNLPRIFKTLLGSIDDETKATCCARCPRHAATSR